MTMKLLFIFFLLTTASLLLVDTIGSFDSTIRHLGINSTFVFICFLLVNIALAFHKKYYFPKKLLDINKYWITPYLTGLTVILVVVNYLTYSTFVLQYFHVHIETFILLAILSGSLTYINHSKNQTLAQKMVYFAGPVFLILMILIDYASSPVFAFLNQEDGIIEYTQFLLYFISGIMNFYLALQFYKKHQFVNLVIFFGLGLILVTVAMEEISWGQRLFGISTPEVIKETNYQGELTIHNERGIQRYIHFFYMGLGLATSLSGVVLLRFLYKFKQKYHILIPSTLTFFYFFSIFVYYFLNQYLIFYYQIFTAQKIGLGRWQEVAELFLATGFLIFAVSVYKKIKREATFLNKPNLEDNPIL